MKSLHGVLASSALCALSLLASCVDLSGEDELELATADQSLSVSSWSAPQATTQSYRSAQVAMLGGVVYKVESGRCGVWTCGDSGEADELWWSKQNTDGTWTPKQRISGQYSGYRVSLAPFNGYLYMVHSGYGSGAANVWLTRFNPATQTWSTNLQLSYRSKGGPPAIAAFNNRLYFAGVDPTNDRVWTASMSTGEVFSASSLLATDISTSRVSLAVMGSKTIPTRLYLAHRHGISTNVVVAKFDGVSWAPWQYVFAGPTGEALQSNEPVIAGADGYLHMVFKRPDSNYVWWTYYNGSSWPTAITLNNLTTTYDPSIGTTSRGVTVATTTDVKWNWVTESRLVHLSKFVTPFDFPLPLPVGR
ncbi:MAG: hypothetical protein R3B48_17960 [Kofleriaceae bacterium]